MIAGRYSRFLLLLILAASSAAWLGVARAGQWTFDGVSRVVALSDIHGDYGAMVRTLGQAGVIDEDGAWSAGATHLVIVGDILDRGAESRAAMDHLMRLEGEASTAGGRVHVLIGNHETMNMTGDLRYVIPEEYAAFADDETSAERDAWFEKYAERAGEVSSLPDFRTRFDERFPPGYFGHRREFAYSGKYGQWLLTKPAIVVINGTAFVHGGLSPTVAQYGLDGVNATLHGELVEFMRLHEELVAEGVLLPTDSERELESILKRASASLEEESAVEEESAEDVRYLRLLELLNSDLHAIDGPLWYRGNVHCSRLIEEDRLLATLDVLGADRLVVGHTPTPTRSVLERFEGKLIEVDTGMNAGYYKGSGHALIIEGDTVSVVSERGERQVPGPHPRRVGVRPSGITSQAALEKFMSEAPIIAEAEDQYGRKIVTLGDSNRRAEGFFVKRPSKSFQPDLAAYRLDQLIELGMVPVTVSRKVGRSEGSVLYIAPKALDEQQRAEAGRGGSATCPLPDQWDAMFVFDALIYNRGRSQNRILYSTDRWQLMLVGHEYAFDAKKGRPPQLEDMELKLNPAWRKALESLTAESVATEFDGILDKRRQKSLLQRRDALLELP